jgi:hypothetical protein
MANNHEEEEMTLQELEEKAIREEFEARREQAKADKKTAKMQPLEKGATIGAIIIGAAATVGGLILAIMKGKDE